MTRKNAEDRIKEIAKEVTQKAELLTLTPFLCRVMKSKGWPSTLLSLLFVHWLVHLLSCSPVVSWGGRQQAVIEYRIGKVSGLSELPH